MHVARLGHAGLALTVPQRSLDFFVGGLGLETCSRRVIDQPWLARADDAGPLVCVRDPGRVVAKCFEAPSRPVA